MSDFGKTVYRVQLFDTPRDQKDFYFGSLAAIYDVLSEFEVGCKLTNLWQAKIDENNPYISRKCAIYKGEIIRRKRGTK